MSWKQYGGLRNIETNRKITTNTVIADEIILKNSYIGGFTINGILDVTGKAIIQGNLEVNGLITSNDISLNTIHVYEESFFNGNSLFKTNIDVTKNAMIGNNLNVNNNAFINNNLTVGNVLYLNNHQFIYGNEIGLGINNLHPTFELDICSNNMDGLKIRSTQLINRNILSSNLQNKGLTLTTSNVDDDGGGTNIHLDFFVVNDISFGTSVQGDAYIKYKSRGDLELNATNHVLALSRMSVSNRPDEAHENIFEEALIVYDENNNDIYKPEYYNDQTESTGNALTLVALDNNSNTFFRIVTPEKKGLSIGGGCYPSDHSRSMGTIGLTDICGNYTQNMMIVSGTNPAKYNSTLGVNNYKPLVDDYVMDINGPTHIDNGNITVINKTQYQINSIAVSPYKNFVIAVGSSIDISGSYVDVSGVSNYRQKIAISYDYGKTWILKSLSSDAFGSGNEKNNYTLNNVFIYDNSYAFIVGNRRTLIYTIDGGKTWAYTIFQDVNTNTITELYNFQQIIVTMDATTITFYITGLNSENKPFLYKYTSPLIIETGIFLSGGNIVLPIISNLYTFTNASLVLNAFDINSSGNPYFATNSGIQIQTTPTTLTRISDISSNYNRIKWNNNTMIAVGTNVISRYDGTTFTNVSFSNIIFNSLYTFNDLFSFTIANNTTMYVTKDGGYTWNTPSIFEINQSGKELLITDPSNQLSNIIMTDDNTFLLTNTTSTYSNTNLGKSNIINCFFPNMCNRINNHILDLSGNMRINGDIILSDGGKIITLDNTFYLLNENVKYLKIGNETREITIGNAIAGNTNIQNNLNVALNTLMNGSLTINGIQNIKNTTESGNISSGAFIVNGGIGIQKNTNIGGNIVVNKSSSFNGISTFNSNAFMNGNLLITANTISSSSTTGSLVTYGGVGIGQGLNVSKNTIISGNLNVNTNTTLNTVNITSNNPSTSASDGALTVVGGVGIRGKLNVDNQLYVGLSSTFNNNVEVVGILNSSDITIRNKPLNFYYVDLTTPQLINGIKTFNNDIIIQSNSDSSNVNVGAVTVVGGVGITGNVNIGNDISSNGSLYVSGNITNGKNITTSGKIIIQNNSESININSGSIITTGGAGIRGNLNVGGNVNIGKNIIITGNTSLSENLYVNKNVGIGKQNPSVALDVSGSMNISGILTTNNIQSPGIINIAYIDDPNTTLINVGNYNPSSVLNVNARTIGIGQSTPAVNSRINIGNPDNPSISSSIYIGGKADNVTIDGTVKITGGTQQLKDIIVYSKVAVFNIDQSGSQYAVLNDGVKGNTSSTDGAGIWINDLSVNNIGQFVVTRDLNGYLFKAPTYKNTTSYNDESLINPPFPSQNILRLDVNGLVTNNSASIVILTPSNDNQTRYTITTSQIDLSNVLLKSKDSISYPNTQVISTKLLIDNSFSVTGSSIFRNDITVQGNTIFNGNVSSNSLTYLKYAGINKTNVIENTSLDVNGNVIVSKLGIGTSKVNDYPNSLEVQGNIYQTSGGFIWQF
jgi:hypothetical protein